MRLTAAERVYVFRVNSGMSQKEAACYWGVGFWAYRDWETSPDKVPKRTRRVLKARALEVTKQLRYVLLRRREGLTQAQLGAELGVSRQWVNRLEQGLEDDTMLRDYWAT